MNKPSVKSQSFQAMTTSRELLCAASQGSTVVIAAVENTIKELLTFAPMPESYTLTDIAWNNITLSRLAISSTNGNISVFDIESAVLKMSGGNPKSVWAGATGTARSAHRINWHDYEPSILISANQDGIIRIFDTRTSANSKTGENNLCQNFNPKCDAIRDIQFNPHNPNSFSAISDNGTLSVWDRRNTDTSILKFLAHTTAGLTLSYHPTRHSILATGGKDKYLKVWDLQDIDGEGHSNILKPIYSIRTPGQVSRLQWRGKVEHSAGKAEHSAAGGTGGNHQHSLFESQIASTSIDRNEVFIWNLNFPHLPVCLVSGHTDACVDFRFVDTPKDSRVTAAHIFQVRI